jgi:branched-subunit amino acid aminotransferase/4-amino-4-deoxychorismate lyase
MVTHFSHNGQIEPIANAQISLLSAAYAQGFAVYETIRASNRIPFFLPDHLSRLFQSAKLIGLRHQFTHTALTKHLQAYLAAIPPAAYNIKLVLLGHQPAELFILALDPIFPTPKLYILGAKLITYSFERFLPHAKTHNTLPSYLAFTHAQSQKAYDALFLCKRGFIREGTRTNFFCLSKQTLFTPPENLILLGVTRKQVISLALKNGYSLKTANIKPHQVPKFDCAFLTSTSSKIIPVRSIDNHHLNPPSPQLKKLMLLFDHYLDSLGWIHFAPTT